MTLDRPVDGEPASLSECPTESAARIVTTLRIPLLPFVPPGMENVPPLLLDPHYVQDLRRTGLERAQSGEGFDI